MHGFMNSNKALGVELLVWLQQAWAELLCSRKSKFEINKLTSSFFREHVHVLFSTMIIAKKQRNSKVRGIGDCNASYSC